MKRRVLSVKVSEDELDVIEENYREFLMTNKKPWSRHKWIKSLLLDRPPFVLQAVLSD